MISSFMPLLSSPYPHSKYKYRGITSATHLWPEMPKQEHAVADQSIQKEDEAQWVAVGHRQEIHSAEEMPTIGRSPLPYDHCLSPFHHKMSRKTSVQPPDVNRHVKLPLSIYAVELSLQRTLHWGEHGQTCDNTTADNEGEAWRNEPPVAKVWSPIPSPKIQRLQTVKCECRQTKDRDAMNSIVQGTNIKINPSRPIDSSS